MEVFMFLKNSMRPALAGVSASGQAAHRKQMNDALIYDAASEADEYGAYSTSAAGNQGRSGTPARKQKKNSSAPIAIAVAAVAVLLLLIVIAVALISGGSKNIKYDDNTFVSFYSNDLWHVAANGKIVGEYEHEITLIPADDRSFAYVIETTDDGYRITVTHGKEVVEITPAPVAKVLATAGLEVGVVWLDSDNGIYLYTEDGGEERITRDVDATAANESVTYFHISGDAKTVIYTKNDADRPGEVHYLCAYRDSSEIKLQKNMYPEAISDDGSMIFASAFSKNAITKSLYVLPFTDENDRYLLSENYLSIVDMNTKGNELVFTTIGDSDSLISTYVVSFNIKKMDEVASPVRIAKGATYVPVSVDPEVARFSTFKETYFQADVLITDIIDNEAPVYFVDKNYDVRRISKYAGKFDAKGEYFYYTNNEGTLQRVDLSDKDSVSQKIAEDVVDFEITEKGNLYWLDDTTRLMFYNTAKEKKTRIGDNVEGISMHKYSNTLYFTFTDTQSIFYTKEGSSRDTAKFESGTVTGLPFFTDTGLKRTFAAFYDSDNDEFRLFYTSNGKTFKFIGECEEIASFLSDFDISDLISDTPLTDSDTTDSGSET